MRYEVDEKHRIVDFYIEDDFGRENHCGLSFWEVKALIEDILWKMLNPQIEEEGTVNK